MSVCHDPSINGPIAVNRPRPAGKTVSATGYTLIAVIGHSRSDEGIPGDDAEEFAWLTRTEIIGHNLPTAPLCCL